MSKENSLHGEKTSDETNSIKISSSVLHRLVSESDVCKVIMLTESGSVSNIKSVIDESCINDMYKIGGIVSEEKLTDHENYWADKLAAIDKDHTAKNGLDISEAENMLNRIDAYLSSKPRRSCPIDTIKVTDCLRTNKGNTLTCEAEVKNFKECIDKSLHAAVSKDIKDVQKSKKRSYLETFERKNIASDYIK